MTAMFDGCADDAEQAELAKALGPRYEVLEHYGSEEGWGHHSFETIYLAHDGRVIFATCGGCSCGGSGSWDYVSTVEEARKQLSEYDLERRDREEEGVVVA